MGTRNTPVPVSTPLLDSLITQRTLAEKLGHLDRKTGEPQLRTLEEWRRNGTGPEFVRLGRTPYYTPEAVDAWILANRRQSTVEEVR